MLIANVTEKMIHFSQGNLHDIENFLKVHAYASLLGRLEGLDAPAMETLELTAIVHDIACPLCRKKYGNANGKYQEAESEPLLRDFFAEFNLPPSQLERIVHLVCHHHTPEAIDGPDYQILIEADYLVNACEGHASREQIETFVQRFVRTSGARRLFQSMYLRETA